MSDPFNVHDLSDAHLLTRGAVRPAPDNASLEGLSPEGHYREKLIWALEALAAVAKQRDEVAALRTQAHNRWRQLLGSSVIVRRALNAVWLRFGERIPEADDIMRGALFALRRPDYMFGEDSVLDPISPAHAELLAKVMEAAQ
ncbi:MAG: hypothetical protein ACI81R_001910 [Bradymonadia bacterium]|jgi:hypothetical protein